MQTARAQRGAGAVLVMAALLVSVMAMSGRASAASAYQIGTFNMAGGHEDHGPKGDEAPDALIASIVDRQPAFITLQEACLDWVTRIDTELADYAVAFDAVQLGDGSTAQCKHPSDFGNAIIYRTDFGVDSPPVASSLQSPAGSEQREMLCVASAWRKIVVCSAHLTAGSDDVVREGEADVAKSILASSYPGYTKFVGGDLNAPPESGTTSRFYHPAYGSGASGEFKEVDGPCGNALGTLCRSGELTHDDWIFEEDRPTGEKIDYLFVSPWVEVRSADATEGIHSDHDPLWADITF
jgi:endonuclease/exonuclease/phosphatase family metal-dependent hydrolase